VTSDPRPDQDPRLEPGLDPARDPTGAFLEHAGRHPECLDPASFALLREENPVPGWPLALWPILVTPEKARAMGDVATALADLARTVPGRFFGDDMAALADYFELPGGEAMAELVMCEPNGIGRALYRGDFIDTADGLKLIEMNAGSGMTGWSLSPLAGLYPRVPAIGGFLDRAGLALSTPDSLGATLAHFVAGARSIPGLCEGPEVNIAVPVSVHDDDIHNAAAEAAMIERYAELQAAARRRGEELSGEARFCSYGDLSFERGQPYLGGRRIHAVFEQQIVDDPLRRRTIGAFKAGLVDLYTGPATQVIMDKRVLVLLSEHACDAGSDRLDEADRALVRSAVPWTRRVAREEVEHRGARVFLPELLSSERAGMVLKKAYSHSGKHVVLGRATPEDEWRRHVAAALAGSADGTGEWIVQEAVESLPYTLLDDRRGPVPHDLVWGLLSFGGGFHGGYVRALPKERDAVINQFHGALCVPLLEAVRR
jgi:hypothetical protein